VYVVRELTSNWKHVVAYYIKGSSVSGIAIWQLTKSIIEYFANRNINLRQSFRLWVQAFVEAV
jgi:hypothetical protein